MKTTRFITGLLVLSLSLGVAAESVYKWKDDRGRVHYSNEPPPAETQAQKVKLVIPSFGGPTTVSQVEGRRSGVVMYGTSSCGYCRAARNYLNARGVPYTDIDVESSDAARAEFQRLGGRGVPVILVGNQRMDGFSAERLGQMLAGAGL